MLFDDFAESHLSKWEEYHSWIYQLKPWLIKDLEFLFPTMLVAREFDEFYAIELVGCQLTPQKMKLKKWRKRGSIHSFLDPFDRPPENPVVTFTGGDTGISNICLARPGDLEAVISRFPYITLQGTTIMNSGEGDGRIVSFGVDFEDTFFSRCSLVNRKDDIYRCRNLLFFAVFDRKVDNARLHSFYQRLFKRPGPGVQPPAHGVMICSKAEQGWTVASHLQNLYLTPNVHETALGEYLNDHPQILKNAFHTECYCYEPSFPWLEHDGTVEDDFINPDIMIKRDDGFFDIVELKLAKTDRERLTKGSRARRRFVDYVNEAIHQTANYVFYFNFEKNRQVALERYGIQVKNPNIYIVVGNLENIDPQAVEEALRAHAGMKFNIIDYDTLVSLFLTTERK